MKLRDVIGSATSNMMRSKVRTILTIIAVFIGAFTITMTLGISAGISRYIDEQVSSIGAEDVVVIQPKIDIDQGSGPKEYDPKENAAASGQAAFMTSMLDSDDVQTIKKEKRLDDIRPMLLVTPDYIAGKSDKKYQLSIQQAIESTRFEYVAGGLPDNGSDQAEILISKDYVELLGFDSSDDAVGETVQVATSTPLGEQRVVEAIVSGVQQISILSEGGLTANNALIEKLYATQTEGLPAIATERYVGVIATYDATKGEDELSAIKTALDAEGYTASTVADQIGVVKDVIDAITAVLIFFGAIALLAASFGIINTLYMSVQERTKEIGLMKAIGMSRSKVFLLFSVEAILIGFWGSLIGVVAAFGVGQVVNKIAADNFLKGLPGFELTAFPLADVLSVMFVIMLIAFLAGTLPARRAAKQDPISALRYE